MCDTTKRLCAYSKGGVPQASAILCASTLPVTFGATGGILRVLGDDNTLWIFAVIRTPKHMIHCIVAVFNARFVEHSSLFSPPKYSFTCDFYKATRSISSTAYSGKFTSQSSFL